ncbi:MAG: MerR family transcriptional regulator [Solirubrobacteraceae bacterium]|nr:MerR family transcriptional regulator [Solirubrobacteraceae bacterium]
MADDEMTIDELARRSGVTVRNIRAHQSRGLLPPPAIRARTGYYGPEHLARLELIRELQAEGFNLKAIGRLLEHAGGAGSEVLGFARSVLSPFADEAPEVLDAGELARRFGTGDPELLRRAERLGLVAARGDGRYEVPSPRLLRAGEEVVALGVPPARALDVLEQINRSAEAVADAFIRLVRDDVLAPIEAGAAGPEGWARAAAAVERLRPLASEAMLAGFQQVMTRAVEKALGEALARRDGGR